MYRWLARAMTVRCRRYAGAVLGGGLFVVGCSADHALAPHREQQDGFTVTYSGPFVVDHLNRLTIRHASDGHSTLIVTVDSARVAGIAQSGCSEAALGSDASCVIKRSYRGDGSGLICDDSGIGDWVCEAPIYSKAPGEFSLTMSAGADTTAFHFSVDSQRVVKIVSPSKPVVARLNAAATFTVALIDQLGAPIRNTKPITAIVDTSIAYVGEVVPTTVAETTITHFSVWGDSVAVTVGARKPGATAVRLSAGAATQDVAIRVTGVADDTAIVLPSGTRVDVTANDGAGASNVRIVRQPSHSSASVVGTAVQVQPLNGFLGLDSLTYVATVAGQSDTGKVRLAMMPGPYQVSAVVDVPAAGSNLGLNDVGQVCATVVISDGTTRAVRWTNGTVDTLEYGGAATVASGIDASGTVVGMSGSTAVLWRPGSAVGESILSSDSPARSPHISSGGTIVLSDPTPQSAPAQLNFNHFVVKDGVVQQSVTQIYTAAAVDDAGDYVGVAFTGSEYPPAIIHYADGHIVFFGGRTNSIAGMNNHGVVVFNAGVSGADPQQRAMLFDGSTQTVLSSRNPAFDWAFQINDAGWIRGELAVSPALMIGRAVAPFQALLVDQSLSVESFLLSNADRVLAKVRDAEGSRYVILTPVVSP
jgi:hypothetical protein